MKRDAQSYRVLKQFGRVALSVGLLFHAFLATNGYSYPSLLAIIEVQAKVCGHYNTPLSLDIKSLTIPNGREITLWERMAQGYEEIPFQIETNPTPRLHWILRGVTPEGKTRIFELRLTNSPSKFDPILAIRNANGILLQRGSKPIMQLNGSTLYPPDGVDTIFRRSGFIHPIWSPCGDTITRIHPPDHYHHFGVWNPRAKTTFEGAEIDFWNLGKGQGTVRLVEVEYVAAGAVFARIKARLEHVTYPDSSISKVAMHETWELKVFGVSDSMWLIDFSSTIACASNSPITLEKHRYGGFTLRGDTRWGDAVSSFLTSEGKNFSNANGARARWCVANGPSGNGRVGIFMAGSASNYNHPEPLRIWTPAAGGATGDLFINFSTTMDTSWVIQPDRSYEQQYRMVVMSRDIDKANADGLWNGYTVAPEVRLVKVD